MGLKTFSKPSKVELLRQNLLDERMPTIAIPALYRSLHEYLMQRIPDDCESRLTNLIWLMMGIYQARSVQLKLAARKVPIRAKQLSIVKRFGRFLDHGKVDVREGYYAFA